MQIKLDENLPADLAEVLAALGHDVETTPGEGLKGDPDETIWAAAQAEKRFFVTQDLDFSDVRRFVPGSHGGILLLRLHNPSRRALIERVDALFREEQVTLWQECVVVASERKLRIRKPAQS